MITSFCIEWHNWGEIHAIDDIAIEITKVSLRKKLLTIGQYNAIGNGLLSTTIPLTNEICDHLFVLVKAVADEASQLRLHGRSERWLSLASPTAL